MRAALLTLALVFATPAAADPEPYALDVANSRVVFGYQFAGGENLGTMPIRDADIALDLDTPSNSRVTARLSPDAASAGVFFATEAMRGPQILDTARFPAITFRSSRVRATGFTAEIDGEITIRDVTRPITLQAQIFRQRGTTEGERDKLSIRLTGAVSRSAFGAGGFADLVGDRVTLDILARLDRVR